MYLRKICIDCGSSEKVIPFIYKDLDKISSKDYLEYEEVVKDWLPKYLKVERYVGVIGFEDRTPI